MLLVSASLTFRDSLGPARLHPFCWLAITSQPTKARQSRYCYALHLRSLRHVLCWAWTAPRALGTSLDVGTHGHITCMADLPIGLLDMLGQLHKNPGKQLSKGNSRAFSLSRCLLSWGRRGSTRKAEPANWFHKLPYWQRTPARINALIYKDKHTLALFSSFLVFVSLSLYISLSLSLSLLASCNRPPAGFAAVKAPTSSDSRNCGIASLSGSSSQWLEHMWWATLQIVYQPLLLRMSGVCSIS